MIIVLSAALIGGVTAYVAWHARGLLAALEAADPANPYATISVLETSIARDPAAAKSTDRYRLRVFVHEELKSIPPGSLPVVIYMPSWGGTATDNDLLLRHLANERYLVIAADDVAQDPAEPGETLEMTAARHASYDLADPAGPQEFVRLADLRTDLSARKVGRIISQVVAEGGSNSGSPLALGDSRRVAVIGYSMGGSVAGEVLRTDRRVLAAINIDGWDFGSSAGHAIDRPFLVFASTNSLTPFEFGIERRNTWSVERLSRARMRPQLATSRTRYFALPGTLHGDYSDGLHKPGRWRNWRPWHQPLAEPRILRDRFDRLVIGFLDEQVASVGGGAAGGARRKQAATPLH